MTSVNLLPEFTKIYLILLLILYIYCYHYKISNRPPSRDIKHFKVVDTKRWYKVVCYFLWYEVVGYEVDMVRSDLLPYKLVYFRIDILIRHQFQSAWPGAIQIRIA